MIRKDKVGCRQGDGEIEKEGLSISLGAESSQAGVRPLISAPSLEA